MANAWGVSFGTAWGVSWGSSAAVTVTVDDLSGHDGKPRPDRSAGRNDEYRRGQHALRRSVETAFERILAERPPAAQPIEASSPQELREIAVRVLPEVRLDGFDASLRQVVDLLAAYQAAAFQARRLADDEEAIMVLLLN